MDRSYHSSNNEDIQYATIYDFDIASSWYQLAQHNKKAIRQHDYIMLKHELYELNLLLNNKNMSQYDAHRETEKLYNYRNAVKEYNRLHSN